MMSVAKNSLFCELDRKSQQIILFQSLRLFLPGRRQPCGSLWLQWLRQGGPTLPTTTPPKSWRMQTHTNWTETCSTTTWKNWEMYGRTTGETSTWLNFIEKTIDTYSTTKQLLILITINGEELFICGFFLLLPRKSISGIASCDAS